MKIKAINGFKDILQDEAIQWRHVEQNARDIFSRFGFQEIRLPILEKTELFARSIGETTDIVEKEMYTFADKGITMRPEATASLLRAFIEHGLHVQQPVQRLFTMGPMFRHERPQKGRLRQFHQIDVEVLGADEPEVDAEVMAMGSLLLERLGINASLEINSLGCPECRPFFRRTLIDFLNIRHDALCDDCRRRKDTNPLRVLDCKKPECRKQVQAAPSILDSLCEGCADHFERVKTSMQQLNVPFSVNHFMVRGLDYYCRTTFEFLSNDLGSQSAVGAGGRYDGLVEQLGGPKIAGIGFAVGIERLILLLQEKSDPIQAERTDLYFAVLGNKAKEFAGTLLHSMRRKGLKAGMDYAGRSLKAQMKQAGRSRARFVLIIGDQELQEQKAVLRNMDTQEQRELPLEASVDKLAESLMREIALRA